MKKPVSVIAEINDQGRIIPIAVGWGNGRNLPVEAVSDIRPMASTKAGGEGMRYTCRIRGRETYLFLNKSWMLEPR